MRNERYRKNAISVRERHNERKNEVYSNPDVLREYSHNNVTGWWKMASFPPEV